MLDRKIFDVFSETADLRPRTQQQLLQVYTTLVSVIVFSMLGCFVAGRVPALGNHELVTLVGIVAGTVAVYVMRPTKENLQSRRLILWTVSWLIGTMIQPAVQVFFYYGNQDILYMALGTSFTLFASFAAVTMITPRRRVIYTVGTAISALASLSWISLIMYFYPTHTLHCLAMLISLAFSCVSVVIHTHNILDQARSGADLDPIVHALTLFNDLASIFVRILAILSNNKRRDEERGRNTRGRSSGRRHFGNACGTSVPIGGDTSGISWSWNL
ncbi:Inhibitor of apoptosis-promoting Bax1-related protein [Coemansia sp. RSA 986]|nr:Inhibitor of apoptosis-promoting Bax1-related protein [Coemansia sp. RSA 986]